MTYGLNSAVRRVFSTCGKWILKLKVCDGVCSQSTCFVFDWDQINEWMAFELCSVTNLWLNIHQTDLVLTQNFMNRLQTGAIQIVFVLAILNKSVETSSSFIINKDFYITCPWPHLFADIWYISIYWTNECPSFPKITLFILTSRCGYRSQMQLGWWSGTRFPPSRDTFGFGWCLQATCRYTKMINECIVWLYH